MSIAAVSSNPVAYQANQQDDARKALLQLISNIKSGDLSGAQQAYDALTNAQGSNGSTTDPNNPITQALSQIGEALKSGDIDGAQKTLATLQSQLRTGKHHHRHGGSENAPPPANNAANTTAPTQSTTVSVTIDITA